MKKRIDQATTTIKDFWGNFLRVLRRADMVLLPGNLSFFFVLAIIPTLGLISYGASILNLSTDIVYDFLANSFSHEIADIILGIDLTSNVGIQFIIAVILGLYIASNSADSIITTSNTIYGIENKSWIKRRIKAFGISFLIVFLLLFMLIVPVFGNIIIELVKEVHLSELITTRIIAVLDLLKGPISWLITFAIIRIIYKVAPDSKPRKRVINYGAIFTTIGFIIVTKIYSLYVTNYAEYTALYGGFANIIILMIWIYLLSYIFTVGIALNNQQDKNNLLKTGTLKIEK